MPSNLPTGPALYPAAGDELRARVEQLGVRLADSLNLVIDGLPGRPTGPRALGRAVGMTTVSASRLLKAIGQTDPIAVIQTVPGPNPLAKMLDEAERVLGGPTERLTEARAAVEAFDDLIKGESGDRGSLRAMLSAWLPGERREFEAQRRQTIFKALTELDGVSSDLEVSTMFILPSQTPGQLDIVNARCLLGIDRIRPDAAVKLGTWRHEAADAPKQGAGDPRPRMPRNLDDEPALDGIHTVRLDQFCSARPAPVVARAIDELVQYELGPTGFGRSSKVDVVIAEVNRAELPKRVPTPEHSPYVFMIPEMPTRKAVLDLIVHDDVYGAMEPDVLCYDTSALGPAAPGDPARATDLRPMYEPLQSLGYGARGARLVEFPRYSALLDHIAERLSLDLDAFHFHRISVAYALPNRQITLAFRGEQGKPRTK